MTHLDLIAAMDDIDIAFANGFGSVDSIVGIARALRGVIELHKYDAEWDLCDVCDDSDYPCKTIQAVEKGLNKWEN